MSVNFKRVSELGLKIIQLENQVLLVDKKSKLLKGDWHIEKELIINQFPNYLTDLSECIKIIASTKPLEGLPLLVIEDEVDRLAYDYCDNKVPKDVTRSLHYSFKQGYLKAKETFKFTEEDLRKAIDMARKFPANSSYYPLHTTDEIIQSLAQKELWIDVYERCKCGTTCEFNECRHEQKLKITNNQIKAVWK